MVYYLVWYTVWFALNTAAGEGTPCSWICHTIGPCIIQQEWRSSQTRRPQVHNPMMHCKLQQIDRNKTFCKVHNPFLVPFVSFISAHSTALIKYQQNHKYCETLRVYERKRERKGGESLNLLLNNPLFRDFSWSIITVWVLDQSAVQRLLLVIFKPNPHHKEPPRIWEFSCTKFMIRKPQYMISLHKIPPSLSPPPSSCLRRFEVAWKKKSCMKSKVVERQRCK